MIRVLAISGSLRSQSSSTSILRALIELAPGDISISIYDRLGNLPHFNPKYFRQQSNHGALAKGILNRRS